LDAGSGDCSEDIEALYETLNLVRDAFEQQLIPVTKILPGANVTSAKTIKRYAQETTWSHHVSRTCPIGADYDPMAVLNSKFRVRGVSRLHVPEDPWNFHSRFDLRSH
jgi:choline dehydrogenase